MWVGLHWIKKLACKGCLARKQRSRPRGRAQCYALALVDDYYYLPVKTRANSTSARARPSSALLVVDIGWWFTQDGFRLIGRVATASWSEVTGTLQHALVRFSTLQYASAHLQHNSLLLLSTLYETRCKLRVGMMTASSRSACKIGAPRGSQPIAGRWDGAQRAD